MSERLTFGTTIRTTHDIAVPIVQVMELARAVDVRDGAYSVPVMEPVRAVDVRDTKWRQWRRRESPVMEPARAVDVRDCGTCTDWLARDGDGSLPEWLTFGTKSRTAAHLSIAQ